MNGVFWIIENNIIDFFLSLFYCLQWFQHDQVEEGIVQGGVSLGEITMDSPMNCLHGPFWGHAIVSEQISTAPWGIVGLNLISFAY